MFSVLLWPTDTARSKSSRRKIMHRNDESETHLPSEIAGKIFFFLQSVILCIVKDLQIIIIEERKRADEDEDRPPTKEHEHKRKAGDRKSEQPKSSSSSEEDDDSKSLKNNTISDVNDKTTLRVKRSMAGLSRRSSTIPRTVRVIRLNRNVDAV
ncbi:unnamed protein product [Thelazia callipaeda]|uniref:Uncharacterized protein n=1 Tax=Thelazia callipaeda TaxID=103827 RepID=A0A0N5CL11_THECL|nr:unnamed protein product [Thelazia callipaeda]